MSNITISVQLQFIYNENPRKINISLVERDSWERLKRKINYEHIDW